MSTTTFEQAFGRLNPEQREAVEQIFGPVMVIAGPGTGKTQILAMRIGNILIQTDTDPRNILCLTYTEAGTVAMRRRLTELIGPAAYNVNIHTFHGFCNQIIGQYRQLFSEHDDLRPVDDLERLDLFIELIDGFSNSHALKKLKGDAYYFRKGLDQVFSVMKTEGWSVDFMNARIDQYISEFDTKDGMIRKREPNKGKPTAKGLTKLDSLERFRAAVSAFPDFEKIMHDAGRFDYADMILWVIKELKKNDDLLADLRERYQFILVDEYQDTNGAQNELLFLLGGDPDEQPNVFAVGDDDQSIYRFQGASVSNIEDFIIRFQQHLKVVVLTRNYRSSQDILTAAFELIENNDDRLKVAGLEFTKLLTAAGEHNSKYNSSVLVGEFESETEELLAVRYYVESLLAKGVDPKEVVILFRSRSHVQPLIRYFASQRIPHDVKKINNILTDSFAMKLISMLRFINNEITDPFSAESSLFELLHYPWFNIPALDIAKLSLAIKKQEDKSWRRNLSDIEFIKTVNLSAATQIKEATALIEAWIKIGVNNTVQQLFEQILYSPPLFKYISDSGEVFHYLKTASTFFNFIKDQADKKEDLQLAELLAMVEKMIQYDIALPWMKIDKTGEGIQLMTAHGAKGLEFEHVVIIGCNSKKWEDAQPPPSSLSFPDTLVQSNTENKEEDGRRLFYVGVTRAKKEALLTYSRTLLNGKPGAPSRFVVELEKSNVTKKWNHDSTMPEKEAFLFSQYAPVPISDADFPPQINEIIQNTVLSISAVNKYLSCPLSYYYEKVLGAPSARTAPMGYGNAIHYALEKSFQHEENVIGGFPSLDKMLFYFKMGMDKYHSHFTKKEMEDLMANGAIKLKAYYEYNLDFWKSLSPSKTELEVSNVQVEGIPVKGFFDRVDIINDQLQVVDYKTGNTKAGKSKLKGPELKNIDALHVKLAAEQNPEAIKKLRVKIQGGDYWRQLVFYKLLAAADSSITKPFQSTYVSFVESDNDTKLYKETIKISLDDERIVREQLLSTYTKIQNKEFSEGCGLPNCRWCAMATEVKS